MEQEILVTGIKVVDLLAPYAKGGKIGEWMIKVSEFCNFDLHRTFSVCVTLRSASCMGCPLMCECVFCTLLDIMCM